MKLQPMLKARNRNYFTKKINTDRLNQLSKPRLKKEDKNNQASKSIIDAEFEIGISKDVYNVDEKWNNLK